MTPKELGELAHLERASPRVNRDDLPDEGEDALLEPGLRKSVAHLRSFAAIPESVHADKPIEIAFDMFASPHELIGADGDGAKVRAIRLERTRVEAGRAIGTGAFYEIPTELVVTCNGYRPPPPRKRDV